MDVFAKNIPRDLNAADHIDWSMPSKKVEGSLVFNRNGERLGIDHLMFDKNSGRCRVGRGGAYRPASARSLKRLVQFSRKPLSYVGRADWRRLGRIPGTR